MRPWRIAPQTRPIAVRDPNVAIFTAKRGSRGDGEANGSSQRSESNVLRDIEVLLVEDDFIVAYDMRTLLEEHGARVLGPADCVAEAQELLARGKPHVAVLDVNLNGELVFPLVEDLLAREVPFVFATAYSDDDRLFPSTARFAPRLAKPVLPNVLVRQIEKLVRRK